LDLGFSNTLAVFNLYRTCRVPADASQNFILPSACLKNNIQRNRLTDVHTTNSIIYTSYDK
jgi:hypothetical protein